MELMYSIKQNDDGKQIKSFLLKQNISRKLLISIKHRGGAVLVNGEQRKMIDQLKEGDYLVVRLPQELPSHNLIPVNLDEAGYPLNIIYEDQYLLVINKPHGIPCIPHIRHKNKTIANSIMHYYSTLNHNSTVHFINRLDKDTSGLMIVAKNRYIHHLMNDKRLINRKYLAIVEHVFDENKSIIINQSIARDYNHPVRRIVVNDDHPNGKTAQTIVKPIKQYPGYALVECELLTGRTHQIRVHLSSIGHPIIGDSLYEGSLELLSRQALHSYSIEFKHPITSENLHFNIQLSKDLKDVIDKLEEYKPI